MLELALAATLVCWDPILPKGEGDYEEIAPIFELPVELVQYYSKDNSRVGGGIGTYNGWRLYREPYTYRAPNNGGVNQGYTPQYEGRWNPPYGRIAPADGSAGYWR